MPFAPCCTHVEGADCHVDMLRFEPDDGSNWLLYSYSSLRRPVDDRPAPKGRFCSMSKLCRPASNCLANCWPFSNASSTALIIGGSGRDGSSLELEEVCSIGGANGAASSDERFLLFRLSLSSTNVKVTLPGGSFLFWAALM